jgi:hypothetical protein
LSIQFPFLKKSWKSPWFQFAPTRSLKTSKKNRRFVFAGETPLASSSFALRKSTE